MGKLTDNVALISGTGSEIGRAATPVDMAASEDAKVWADATAGVSGGIGVVYGNASAMRNASDDARYINGAGIAIDGGVTTMAG